MKANLLRSRAWLLVVVLALLLGVGGITAQALGVTLDGIHSWTEAGLEYLKAHPALLFLAIVLLPSLPFPVSLLLLAAGVVYGERYGPLRAGLITLAAMTINFSWTYWVARSPLRRFVKWMLGVFDARLPELSGRDAVRFAVIIRITPGIPFFLQNHVLGLSGIPFRPYFLVSLPAQVMWTFGFVLSGGALFKGDVGLALMGSCLLITAVLVTKMVRKRLQVP